MAEYICLEETIVSIENILREKENNKGSLAYLAFSMFVELLKQAPTADVVSIEAFEQVKWERDTALKTLEEHGIGLAQKPADKVEVVRCKNCEHFKAYSDPLKGFYGECMVRESDIGENDFCSYGIRKEGAENDR